MNFMVIGIILYCREQAKLFLYSALDHLHLIYFNFIIMKIKVKNCLLVRLQWQKLKELANMMITLQQSFLSKSMFKFRFIFHRIWLEKIELLLNFY
jgi:hypothetical protein